MLEALKQKKNFHMYKTLCNQLSLSSKLTLDAPCAYVNFHAYSHTCVIVELYTIKNIQVAKMKGHN